MDRKKERGERKRKRVGTSENVGKEGLGEWSEGDGLQRT